MNRLLQGPSSIAVTIDPNALVALCAFVGEENPSSFLLRHLTASVWVYSLDERLRLVTRAFVADAMLTDRVLLLSGFAQTTPQDIMGAFKDGRKIVGTWVVVDGNYKSDSLKTEGATWLCNALRNEDDSRWLSAPAQNESTEPAEAICAERMDDGYTPQDEIDRLIGALRSPTSIQAQPLHSVDASPHEINGLDRQKPAMDISLVDPSKRLQIHRAEMVSTSIVAEKKQAHESSSIRIGVNLDDWLDIRGIRDRTQLETAISERISFSLVELLAEHLYTLVIFEYREDLEQELKKLCAENLDGTLLVIWDGYMASIRLGQAMEDRLNAFRARYRVAAASLAASWTKIQQYEQVLPRLEEQEEQRTALVIEEERLAGEMRELRLKQVMSAHEGRLLSTNVFAIEAKRRLLIRKFAKSTYKASRRSACSILDRFSVRRARARFLNCQRQLESCFDQLSLLEGEVKRRLEYQADWQSLVRRQVKIQHELEEIARFAKATAYGYVSTDMRAWIKAERDAISRREKLLQTWQNYLNERFLGVIRSSAEKLTILSNNNLLRIPILARGAFIIVVTHNGEYTTFDLPDECSSWLVTDLTWKTITSGQGLCQSPNPLQDLLSELAREQNSTLEETLHALDLNEDDLTY